MKWLLRLKIISDFVRIASPALSDFDYSAKAYMALHYLGRNTRIEPLVSALEVDEHFVTYRGERNASFSTNANVLNCLLMLADPTPYISQILIAVKFLCRHVAVGSVTDKWVREPSIDHRAKRIHWLCCIAGTNSTGWYLYFHHSVCFTSECTMGIWSKRLDGMIHSRIMCPWFRYTSWSESWAFKTLIIPEAIGGPSVICSITKTVIEQQI